MTAIDPTEFGVTEVAAELHDALHPGQTGGELPTAPEPDNLLAFCNALATIYNALWIVAQEGWETILDPEAAPEFALGYLAQFDGAQLQPGFTIQQKRDAISHPTGFDRGTPASILEAGQRTLTGQQVVNMVEREPDAYNLLIRTLLSETPDADATEAAFLSQVPAGIILDYAALAAQDYATLNANFASYGAVDAAYDSYDELAADL